MSEAAKSDPSIDRARFLAGGSLLAFAGWVLIHPIVAAPVAAVAIWKAVRA